MLTGHRGYIGSHLLPILTKKHSVVGFDLQDGQDLYDVELNEKFDLIIHLAGKSGVRESLNDPAGYSVSKGPSTLTGLGLVALSKRSTALILYEDLIRRTPDDWFVASIYP